MSLILIDPNIADFVDQICTEYNHADDVAALVLVPEYLRLFAVKSLVSPYLVRLYAKRAFAQYLQDQHLEDKDYNTGDIETRAHFVAKNFEAEIKALTDEIDRTEGQVQSVSAKIGQLTNAVPAASPAGRFPANSPVLLGDPNTPRWYRR